MDKGVVSKVLIASLTLLAVSGLIEIYGLSDSIFFNKGILSAGLFCFSMWALRRLTDDYRQNHRTAAAAFLLSALLAWTELLGIGLRLRATGGTVIITLPSVLWITGSAFLLAVFMEPLFYRLMNSVKRRSDAKPDTKQLNQVFFQTWLLVFLGYLPCLLAFFPGLYCYDMSWQWAMFASGTYNTHHPLLHTLFSGGLLETGYRLFGSYQAGLALHSIVQLAILSGCGAFAVRYLVKISVPPMVWKLTAAFYVLFPFFPVLGISTTKDTLFSGLFLIVFVCICDMVTSRKCYCGKRLVLFLAVTALMGSFRNNAVYGLCFTALCLLIAYVILHLRQNKSGLLLPLAGALILSSLGSQSINLALEKGLDADKGSVAEALSIPFQQLARIYVYHEDEMNPADQEELFRFIPADALSGYKYYVSDPVKAGLNSSYLEANKADFFRLWLRIGRQFPGEAILATAYNTMGLWYLGGDSSCFVLYEMGQPFDEAHQVEMHSLLPPLKNAYSWFTDANLQKHLPMVSIPFYTSFYSWMVLILTVVILVKKRYSYLVLPAVLIGYLLTLVPGPCIIVRYMMGIMMCAPVFGAVIFYGMEETI